jgi:flagellar motor switch protein FliM
MEREREEKQRGNISGEVLSQDEIDALLISINAMDTLGGNEFQRARDTRKIKIYDFRRPDKFTKKQIRAIQILHGNFCGKCSALWSSRLRTRVSIHVAAVDQMTREEFMLSVPSPAVLPVIDMSDSIGGRILMEISPPLSFTIVNRMYGGEAEFPFARRELTGMENIAIEDLVTLSIATLRESWGGIADFRPKINRIETGPQFCAVAPPNEMGVLVICEVKIGDVEGVVNIYYPHACLEKVKQNLSALRRYGNPCVLGRREIRLAGKDEIPVKLTAEIIRRDYTVGEICGMSKGELLLPVTPREWGICFIRAGNYRIWECAVNSERAGFHKSAVIKNICAQPFGSEGKMEELQCGDSLIGNALQNAGITISVELGSAVKTIKEILQMDEGTIVELDRLAGEPVDIKANGVLIAKGEVVVIDETFGVRVTEIGGSGQGAKEKGMGNEK